MIYSSKGQCRFSLIPRQSGSAPPWQQLGPVYKIEVGAEGFKSFTGSIVALQEMSKMKTPVINQ